jgi:hypothetical protein
VGWNDRLPEDPYIPYQNQSDCDAYEAYAAYVDSCRQNKARKTDIGVCMKHRHRKKIDAQNTVVKKKKAGRVRPAIKKKAKEVFPF